MLRPIEADCTLLIIGGELSTSEYQQVAELVEVSAGVAVQVQSDQDTLDFLKFFPRLKRFGTMMPRLRTLDGLRLLRDDLEELSLGSTIRQIDLAAISPFKTLRKLYLEGHTKGIEVLAGLVALEDLTLRSITLPDLGLLRGLDSLRSLDIKLGGTRDLTLLPDLRKLKYLELWMIRGLDDLGPVARTSSLQYVHLQDLPQVTGLPDLMGMVHLRRVWLEHLKSLRDVCAFARAPALEELALVSMTQLTPDRLRCLVGHRSLRYLVAGLGSRRKNDAAKAMFPGWADGQLDPFEFR